MQIHSLYSEPEFLDFTEMKLISSKNLYRILSEETTGQYITNALSGKVLLRIHF